MAESRLYIYEVDIQGQSRRYVSPLPHEIASRVGLSPHAVMGELAREAEGIHVDHFAPNAEFVQFLHRTIDLKGRDCPDLIAAAGRQVDGYVYIIDQRTKDPDGDVPPGDILGGFQVKSGAVGSYRANDVYVLVTSDGPMQLDDCLHALLLEVLASDSGKAT
jgi:hypothetical protein